jgi:hypothetical protein
VKILRLTNSSDLHPGVPEEERAPAVAARLVEEAIGEPVETLQRGAWPSPSLADAVQRWVEEFEPDVVLCRLSSYWVAYESIPLRLNRRFGRAGTSVANAGGRIGRSQWLAERRAYRFVRTNVTRAIGGDTHFTPAEAVAGLEAAFRRVLALESIVPVVRGTSLMLNTAGTRAGLRRSTVRVAELNARTEEMCRRLRISFFPEPPAAQLSQTRLSDQLHDDAAAHAALGRDDGLAILEALQTGDMGRWSNLTVAEPAPAN